MSSQIKKLLAIGAAVGLGYFAFQHFTSEKRQKVQIITLEKTRRIAQEIKHQILIVTVTFTDGMKDKMKNIKSEEDTAALVEYFTTKMSEIYQQKQELILTKFNISKLQYEQSLAKYSNDDVLERTKNDIIEAMDCAVNGKYPNLDVDPKAAKSYGKVQLEKIYQDLSINILTALTEKLRQKKKSNPQFNSNDNAQFKSAVRQLDVFGRKQEMLKNIGFKPQWGSSNEVFLKLMESQKLKDAHFKLRMKNLEEIYDGTVQKIAADPIAFKIESINTIFGQKEKEAEEGRILSKSMIASKTEDEEFVMNKSTRSEYKEKQNQEDLPDEAKAL